MEIIRYIAKKNSVKEHISLNFSTFTSKEKYTSRKKMTVKPKFKIVETIVAKGRKEIAECEKFLNDSITSLVVFPLFSTKTVATTTENTDTITGDFQIPWTNVGDLLCYGSSLKALNYVEITAINAGTITVSSNVSIDANDLLMTGKVMTLDKKIAINKTSNAFWEFNIMGSEL